MRKIKLAEVGKKGWKISREDRSALNKSKNNLTFTKSMGKITEAMQANVKLTEGLVDAVLSSIPNKQVTNDVRTPEVQPVEVVFPPDTAKKAFRLKVSRDNHGFIEYVDIQQV